MKKAVVTILTLALVLSLSMVFVACDKEDTTQTASNADVLGTAVAVATQFVGGATASAEDNANVDFKGGVNLSIGENNQLIAGGELVASGVGAMVKPVMQSAVNSVKNMLGEKGIAVGKVDNDDADFNEKYEITITHVDEETAEETVEKLALYIKLTSDGDSIEGKTNYTFNAKVAYVVESDKEDVEDKYVTINEFSGKATFDDIKDAMIFNFGAEAGSADSANAFAGIKAYGTATGSVVVEMGAGAGVSETLGASASLSIEVGKLADGKYGATITATGKVEISALSTSADFVAAINVYANSTENAGEFALNGKVEITVSVPIVGTYKGEATLDGKAVYDADKDEAVVGLNGSISFNKVEKENN